MSSSVHWRWRTEHWSKDSKRAAREFLAKSGENTIEQLKEENQILKHQMDCMVKEFGTMSDDLKSQKLTIETATRHEEQLLYNINSLDAEKRNLKAKISGLEDEKRQQVALVLESKHKATVERDEFEKALYIRKRELNQESEKAAGLEKDNLKLNEESAKYQIQITKLEHDLDAAHLSRLEMKVLMERRAEEFDEQNAQLRVQCEDFKSRVKELGRKLGIAEDRCMSRGNTISNQKQIAKETDRIFRQLASLQEQRSKLLSEYSTLPESATADQELQDCPASALTTEDEKRTEYKIIATTQHKSQSESNTIANTGESSETRNSATASQQTEPRSASVLAMSDETQHKSQNETDAIASIEQTLPRDKQKSTEFHKLMSRRQRRGHRVKTSTDPERDAEHGPVLRDSPEIGYYDWIEAKKAKAVA